MAKNEALFREVNECITVIREALAPGSNQPDVVDGLICECSDPLCVERVGPLTMAEYEEVRRDPTRFIIAAGHQAADVESVVRKHPAYWVVEKHEGVPSKIARERDPRS